MIWTALNYLHRVELFVVQRWMICTMLIEFYCVVWFVLRWMICTTLNDFLLRCKIVPPRMTCTAKGLYSVERFVLCLMIRSAMDDLYKVESFGLRLVIDYRFFNECQVCLIEKISYFALTSELIFPWFGNNIRPCPTNWSQRFFWPL